VARTRGANIWKYLVERDRREDKKDGHRSDPCTSKTIDPPVQSLCSCIQQPRTARKIRPQSNLVSQKKKIPNKLQFKTQSENIRVQFLHIAIPCLKVSCKYHTTARTVGCDNRNYQTTSRELLGGLRSTATVTVHGRELHSHATSCTYCLIATRLQSSKHIS
jgi:hypothetical protein